MDIGTRMKNLRIELGYTLEYVAKAVDTSKQTIQRYETGIISNIPSDKIEKIARVLNTTPAYLMGWEEEPSENIYGYANVMPLPPMKKFPMLGNVACGEPILAVEETDEYVIAPSITPADFALTCRGDSMVGARINDGDIVFIRRQEYVDNGDIAVVIIEDEATLKRVYKDTTREQLTLMPENPAYAPLVYRGEELEHIRILGKVVAFYSPRVK